MLVCATPSSACRASAGTPTSPKPYDTSLGLWVPRSASLAFILHNEKTLAREWTPIDKTWAGR